MTDDTDRSWKLIGDVARRLIKGPGAEAPGEGESGRTALRGKGVRAESANEAVSRSQETAPARSRDATEGTSRDLTDFSSGEPPPVAGGGAPSSRKTPSPALFRSAGVIGSPSDHQESRQRGPNSHGAQTASLAWCLRSLDQTGTGPNP